MNLIKSVVLRLDLLEIISSFNIIDVDKYKVFLIVFIPFSVWLVLFSFNFISL